MVGAVKGSGVWAFGGGNPSRTDPRCFHRRLNNGGGGWRADAGMRGSLGGRGRDRMDWMGVCEKWYWRAAAAAAVGGGCSVFGFFGITLALGVAGSDAGYFRAGLSLFPYSLIPLVPGVLVFHWLTVRHGGFERDRETRCRGCGYILRGISEPRCSECGERI